MRYPKRSAAPRVKDPDPHEEVPAPQRVFRLAVVRSLRPGGHLAAPQIDPHYLVVDTERPGLAQRCTTQLGQGSSCSVAAVHIASATVISRSSRY